MSLLAILLVAGATTASVPPRPDRTGAVAHDLTSPVAASASGPCPRTRFQIVVPRGPLRPGERVQLRTAPPTENATGMRWQLRAGAGSLDPFGSYRAPFVVQSGATEVTVQVICKGDTKRLDTLAVETLRLLPGVFPGADSCLGAGQTWGPGGTEPSYAFAEELPEAITTVQAAYLPSARARGITGTVVINPIVCRSGRVLDGFASRPVGMTPEPILEQAALDAARQWVFKPARKDGQPVATTVAIPFAFKP